MPGTDPASPLTPSAQRILDVASELFYAHGIHAVGVDTIAAESGVTKRTLYNRFGSKDALVAAYLQQRHEAWWAHLESRVAAADPPRALAVFDASIDSPLEVHRGCAFLNGAGELPADHPGFAVIRAHKHAVRRRLAELVAEAGPEEDPETLAEHLFLLLEGGIADRGIDAEHIKRARDLARGILAG